MNLNEMSNDDLIKLRNQSLENAARYKTREQALKILINSLYGA